MKNGVDIAGIFNIRNRILFPAGMVLLLVLFCLDMRIGSVSISFKDILGVITGRVNDPTVRQIVLDIRMIKSIVAVLVGSSLTVSGLEMQTLFRNPLAGPYVLGISSGASLGVAIFILGSTLFGIPASWYSLGIAGSAWLGSAIVLAFIAIVGLRIRDIMVILILGMMFSSGISAIVQILQYLSRDEALKSFVVWTMGSLGNVTRSQLWIFIPSIMIGLILGIAAIKPLNLLLFGEEYARSMGLNPGKSRLMILLSTTLLSGTSTAFCGPIGFIGLAIPHLSRMIFSESNHCVLLPASILMGGIVMLICDILSKILIVPINAITALLGIPIVIYVVIKAR